MLDLNIGIRSVAFLFLNSSFFSICNQGRYLVGSNEQQNHVGPIYPFTCDILMYNPNSIPNQGTYKKIAHEGDANFIPAVWIQGFNSSLMNRSRSFNVIVGCSRVEDFRLFFSHRLWQKETLDAVPSTAVVQTSDLLPFTEPTYTTNLLSLLYLREQVVLRSGFSTIENITINVLSRFCVDYTVADRITEDVNANDTPLKTCSEPGLSPRAIVGITVGAVVVAVMSHARCLYKGVYGKKKGVRVQLMHVQAPNGSLIRSSESSGALVAGLSGIRVDKAVVFSYEELSKATNNFSLGNKIGQGGFGAVYYAELRGEKVAIKQMDMQASKQFLAELKVLSHVHHLNLVRLIGYCVEGSHFLVYEYIENGNLSQHLHESERDPLSWPTRVQIALDSARGLEYIHEYTVSVFIHCDIKSTNILIDENLHGKVADFGLTRLTNVGSRSRLVGTFGYMSPEYAQYGDVSPKVDVYAFGVVLYELISGKPAIIRANGSNGEPRGLVTLFDEVLSQTNLKDDLVKMVDPRLGDNYPLDSVHKMAQLAKACTHEDPKQRLDMRSIVVALMTLSSFTEDRTLDYRPRSGHMMDLLTSVEITVL